MNKKDLLTKLIADRDAALAGSSAIVEAAATENRSLTADETTANAGFMSTIDALDTRIAEVTALVAQETAGAELRSKLESMNFVVPTQELAGSDEVRAFLEGETRALVLGGVGGVPTEVGTKYVAARNKISRIFDLAQVIVTETSDTFVLPRETAQGSNVTVTADGDDSTGGDPTIGNLTFGAHQLFKSIEVGEILSASSAPVLDWAVSNLGRSVGKARAALLATGTGTGQPQGLFAATPSATITGAVDHDKLIDQVAALAPEYLSGAVWVMGPAVLASIRKLKDGNDRPIYDSASNQLHGFPVVVDSSAPADHVAFGDVYSALIVRMVGNIPTLVRAEDARTGNVILRVKEVWDSKLADTAAVVVVDYSV